MSRFRLALAALSIAGLLAGCTSVLNGKGSTALSPSGGPSRGPGAAAAPTSCPHVVFPSAKLSFDCITTGMTAHINGPVWPLSESRTVEPATDWVLEEGAGHWGAPTGQSLASIANTVRQRMVGIGGYGVSPKITTDADKDIKIDGVPGHLLQTTFTINPAWARTAGTKVKREKLWIVVIQVGRDDVSLWYTSVPDLVSQLWPKVPSIIATIKVG